VRLNTMNRAVALLTGVHVLLHSIFGCCNHTWAAHSHETSTPHRCHDEIGSKDATSVSHCNEQDADACSAAAERICDYDTNTAADRAASTDERHSCRHASCAWLTTITVPELVPVDCGCPFVIATAEALAAVPQRACFSSDSTVIGRIHPLPLRLHLAVGVLLI
jgi:hypothetical protein